MSTIENGELLTLAKQCNYVIENRAGVRFEIYARNDEDFYEKVKRINFEKTGLIK